MNTSEQTPQLLRFLRKRRDAVVDRWHDAIAHTAFTSLTTEEIRRRLGDLTDQAIVLLLSEPFERSKAREIGSALAGMHCLSADTLSGTQEVLARQLVEDLPADEAAALQPRLAMLLAEVGAGFFGQTREANLLEEEQTKATLIEERKQIEDELRNAHDELELRIRERTAELTRANKELRAEITERNRTEKVLRQSERLYRTVVEQAGEYIFLADTETERILEANTAFHRSLGYAPEELKGLRINDVVAHDQEIIDPKVRRALREGTFTVGERSYRRKDGSLVDVEVSVSAIPYDSREALCVVSHDVTERKRAEESLRQSLSVLLALREAGQILGSTLESEEIVSRLLEIMQRVSNLTATVISVQDEDGRVRIWRSIGLEELWQRARFVPEAMDARRATLETEEQHLFLLQRPNSETEYLAGLYLPLRTREHTLGVLEAYGPESLADGDTVEILSSLASQAARALENARLYGELAEREHRLQDLIGKLLGAQEEERRRVAYEVHDGLAQTAVAAHQRLQAFARRYSPVTEKSQRDLERILRLVRQTVSDARRIIANLRPTTLDDLGLAATIALEVERLREDDYRVDYEEDLGKERLPAMVEITLFRVIQEALTNIRKHAQTERVHIKLRRWENEAYLEVRDYGQGFDPSVSFAGSGPGERVGLAGMRERVGMLGGQLEIHSQRGTGTSVTVKISLLATVQES